MVWKQDSVIVKKEQLRAHVASPTRRWWTRIINTLATLIAPLAAIGVGATEAYPDWADILVVAYGFWIVNTAVVGLLYGRGWSPGQLLMSTTSRRTRDGRVTGAFRGMLRFVAFPFFPFLVLALFSSPGGDLPAWSDDVIVTDRKLTPLY